VAGESLVGESSVSVLDDLVREGARRMLAAALQAEVAAYIDEHAGEVDEVGRRLVVRNGSAQPRQVLVGLSWRSCKPRWTILGFLGREVGEGASWFGKLLLFRKMMRLRLSGCRRLSHQP
jgi:hypothetical protein